MEADIVLLIARGLGKNKGKKERAAKEAALYREAQITRPTHASVSKSFRGKPPTGHISN